MGDLREPISPSLCGDGVTAAQAIIRQWRAVLIRMSDAHVGSV